MAQVCAKKHLQFFRNSFIIQLQYGINARCILGIKTKGGGEPKKTIGQDRSLKPGPAAKFTGRESLAP